METSEGYENRIMLLENENSLLKRMLVFHEHYNEFSDTIDIFKDPSGKIIYLSPQFEKITGYNCEDFLSGKIQLIDLVIPEDVPKVQDAYILQNKARNVSDILIRIKDKNQSIKFLSVFSQPVFNRDKEYAGSRTTCTDISVLRQAELAFGESQVKLNKIFNNSFEGIILVDDEGYITEWNSGIAGITGIPREDVLGEFVWRIQYSLLIPELKAKTSEQDFEDQWKNKIVKLGENEMFTGIGKLRSAAGDIKFIEDLVTPFILNNRKFYCVFQRDMTEHKKVEEALKEREEHLRLITDNLPVLINHTDLELRYLFVNDYYPDVFGIPKEQFIGKKISEIMGQKAFEVSSMYFDQVFSGHTVSFENKITDKNQQERTLQLILVPEFNADEVTGFFTIGIDVTQQRMAGQIIEQQNAELLRRDTDKDRFMSILAHDLKSPFGSILGFLDLLADNFNSYNGNEIKDIINLVNDSAHKTFNLMEDLLHWTNARSGKLTLSPEKINLSMISDEIIIALEPMMKKKNIKIIQQVSDEIYLIADKNILKTVIRNLVNNAIKFTNRDGLVIISLKPGHESKTIIVSDNGVGIEKADLEKLFDPTHRISTSGTQEETGTGLGLLLCKEFVEKMGGKIWAESTPGKGSSFKFTVPDIKE
jgi:PAS domain S-box-containing protein